MNKYIKKGMKIAGTVLPTLVYTLTFAYAQPSTETPKEIKPYSFEKTAETYKNYMEAVRIAKIDQKIEYTEIESLYKILEESLPHMPQLKSDTEFKKIIDYINKNLKNEIIKEIEDPTSQKDFFKVRGNLDEKVLTYFPNLINKGTSSITYPSNQKLDQKYNLIMKELIFEANKLFEQKKDKDLSNLTEKEQYTIQDLLAFYSILDNKTNLFGINKRVVKRKFIPFDKENLFNHKEKYESFIKSVEEWKKGEGYCIPYISAGIRPLTGNLKYDNGEIKQPGNVSDEELKTMLSCKIEDVEYQFPCKPLLGTALGIILGIFAPFAIKGLIIKYTRRKFDDIDGWEVGASAISSCLIDALHPLAMPLRLFAIPAITEYIGKFNSDRTWRNRKR